MKINPTEIAPVSYNKARIDIYRGDFEAATAEIERGRARGAEHPSSSVRRQIWYFEGKLDESARVYEDVFEAVPTMRGLLPLLGIVYAAAASTNERRSSSVTTSSTLRART